MASHEPAENGRKSLLSASAEGAKFLILLQVGSRLLTFIVNQVLLRFISPQLLGISVQLELFMISVLYFSRESLRTALQRYTAEVVTEKRQDVRGLLVEGTLAAQSQTVVNLSLLTVPLGVVFATVLAFFYSHSFASSETTVQPYFNHSIALYILATLLELMSEPCFALSQQKLLYKLRAGAESAAAFTRCVLTCGLTVCAARVVPVEGGLGPLPFAVGQVGYAVVLLGVYWRQCFRIARVEGFSMGFKGITSRTGIYNRALFHKQLSILAASMWIQAFVKHLLTHLDSLLIAIITSTHDQGIYALAANYGSLLARMLFQPIEEASRNLFAKLLSNKAGSENVRSAANILRIILKLYTLFSLFLLSFAPPFAPILLSLLLGDRWGSGEAGEVLSVYCYYIPLLAINGVTEAFVQSVATERELAKQSAWMGLFSGIFAATGWVFLGLLGWGAKGLVVANSVGMVLRVVWSVVFIGGYFEGYSLQGDKASDKGGKADKVWSMGRVLPSPFLVAAAVGAGVVARGITGSSVGLVKEIGVGGSLGVLLIGVCIGAERKFFEECLAMFRSTRAE